MGPLNKSPNHGKHGTKPRLDRRDANRTINYDSSKSSDRMKSNAESESDESYHSHDDWLLDEFPVHGRGGVEEMNNRLRYYGIHGPANLGIPRDDWDAVKKSPPGDQAHGSGDCPDQEFTSCLFPVPEPDHHSLQATAFLPPRQEPGESSSSSSTESSLKRSLSLDAGSSQLRSRNASLDGDSPAEAAPRPSRDSNGTFRKEPHDFLNVVRQAVAQARMIKDEEAAVTNFIYLHKEDDLLHLGSLSDRIQSSSDPSVSSNVSRDFTQPSANSQRGRTVTDPTQLSLVKADDSALRENALHGPNEEGIPLSTQQVDVLTRQNSTSESGPKVSNSLGRSNLSYDNSKVSGHGIPNLLQRKDQAGMELTRPKMRHDVNKSSPSPAVGSLRRPPPMTVLYRQELQASSEDLLKSLAPDTRVDNQDIPGELYSSVEDYESSIESSDEAEGIPSRDGPEGVPNGGDRTADPMAAQLARPALMIEVPGLEPEQLNLNEIGQNPESELQVVARPSHGPVGPRFPWAKGQILGAGSFGTVYQAVDSAGMFFAVKEVSLEDRHAQQSVSQLMQEIELLSQFKHENIVQYLGTETADGKLYIFLELASVGSLASVYKSVKLPLSVISAYTRHILEGLKYLHDQNIVHRDIKCANILLEKPGTCKLADFGVAKRIGTLDQVKSLHGTAHWMAPEVILPEKTYGKPADIWSLGCSVLEMATGSPPFGNMEWARILWIVGHGTAPPIPEFLSDIAKDFIRQCLEIDPMKRPTASQLLEHPFV